MNNLFLYLILCSAISFPTISFAMDEPMDVEHSQRGTKRPRLGPEPVETVKKRLKPYVKLLNINISPSNVFDDIWDPTNEMAINGELTFEKTGGNLSGLCLFSGAQTYSLPPVGEVAGIPLENDSYFLQLYAYSKKFGHMATSGSFNLTQGDAKTIVISYEPDAICGGYALSLSLQ